MEQRDIVEIIGHLVNITAGLLNILAGLLLFYLLYPLFVGLLGCWQAATSIASVVMLLTRSDTAKRPLKISGIASAVLGVIGSLSTFNILGILLGMVGTAFLVGAFFVPAAES